MVASELGIQGYGIFGGVISAIKDIIHLRSLNDHGTEAIRSTVISACCGPRVSFQSLSQAIGIYGNRNYMKLSTYKKRRDAYLAGSTSHMRGLQYAPHHYGFTEDVMKFMRD